MPNLYIIYLPKQTNQGVKYYFESPNGTVGHGGRTSSMACATRYNITDAKQQVAFLGKHANSRWAGEILDAVTGRPLILRHEGRIV